MISVINKVRRPRRTNGILPSPEEIIYNSVLPVMIKKVKQINTAGKSTKIVITGPPSNFKLEIDSNDEQIIKKIKSCFK